MTELLDAYGEPFDPRPVIARWRLGEEDGPTQELWERLYHQGEVGSASFAAIPDLVELIASSTQPDWNAYAILASVEEARTIGDAMIPLSLADAYAEAWTTAQSLALQHLAHASEDKLVCSLLAVIAHAKGQHSLAAIALCTEDERCEMLGS